MTYRRLFTPAACLRQTGTRTQCPATQAPSIARATRDAKGFSTTSRRQESHYETLNVAPDASPKEIKTSFYALSKTTHPDRNPSDPSASQRFVRISEAYAVLRSPEKRARYDREVLHRATAAQTGFRVHPHGSHFSGGPAGGRPASGLSKRRTHFRGPPPSFYRNGGWGAHAEARAREASKAEYKGDPAGEPKQDGGMGAGQSADYAEYSQEIPHFDREGHLRTQRRQESRKRAKMKGTVMEDAMPSSSLVGQFFLVGGLIVFGAWFPFWLAKTVSGGRREKKEKKEKSAAA